MIIAQIISCGYCCDYFPAWMCLSFRTATILFAIAAFSVAGFVNWRQLVS